MRMWGVVVGVFFFFGGGFFKTFLEGSMDHIIYRDYIANRRSFIYCSLVFYAQQPEHRSRHDHDGKDLHFLSSFPK